MINKKTRVRKYFISSLRTFLIVLILTFCTQPLYTQNKYYIDYYGIVADSIDDNMSKMTSDLYYSQLCEINNYSVEDKRQEIKMSSLPVTDTFDDTKLSLYAVISKKENSSKWISTINIYDSTAKAVYSEAKEFDSFYKILMEPKASLEQTITALLSNSGSQATAATASVNTTKSGVKVQSTEFLSGTWGGEDSIEKIVIMRGGRGFVIFKNGASMNITVEIKASGAEQIIEITQSGKANASFFTELPRELALKEAVNAQPIKWIFQAADDNTLSGTKSTLIPENGTASNGTLNVTWKRKS